MNKKLKVARVIYENTEVEVSDKISYLKELSFVDESKISEWIDYTILKEYTAQQIANLEKTIADPTKSPLVKAKAQKILAQAKSGTRSIKVGLQTADKTAGKVAPKLSMLNKAKGAITKVGSKLGTKGKIVVGATAALAGGGAALLAKRRAAQQAAA